MRNVLFCIGVTAIAAGCVGEASIEHLRETEGLKLTVQTPEHLAGTYRQGELELVFDSEDRLDFKHIGFYANGQEILSMTQRGADVKLSLPQGTAPVNDKSAPATTRYPELILVPWIAHDLGSRGIVAAEYPSVRALQKLAMGLNQVYHVNFGSMSSTSGEHVGMTQGALAQCEEFICTPDTIFDPSVCDCVSPQQIADRQKAECIAQYGFDACNPQSTGGNGCGSCGPNWLEGIKCGIWALVAIATPGVGALFTALEAGDWASVAEAIGFIGGEQVAQKLKIIPGVDSCACVVTAAQDGCAANLCSVISYALGNSRSLCN
jgi:hypothetical protein